MNTTFFSPRNLAFIAITSVLIHLILTPVFTYAGNKFDNDPNT